MLYLPVWNISKSNRDNYRLELTVKGWKASFIPGISDPSECDPNGYPFLQRNAKQDSIHYPEGFGDFLGYLWQQARENDMNEQTIQEQLNLLGAWQEAMEKSRPKGIWKNIM